MVQQQTIALGYCGRIADDVNNWDVFTVGAGDGVDRREFTNTKSGDQRRNAVYPSISICCIS